MLSMELDWLSELSWSQKAAGLEMSFWQKNCLNKKVKEKKYGILFRMIQNIKFIDYIILVELKKMFLKVKTLFNDIKSLLDVVNRYWLTKRLESLEIKTV
jgi:hypothetical protein